MSRTTERAAAMWADLRRRWPEIPPLQTLWERQEPGNLMRYDKHPDFGPLLVVFPGLFETDQLYADNGHLEAHEGGHALERERRRAGEPADAEVRRFVRERYGSAGDRLYAIAQPRWGERDYEHYAECFRAIALGVDERIGPDLNSQLLDLGVPLDRARMEAFFAPRPQLHDDPIGHLMSFPVTRPFGDMSFPQYGAHSGVDLGLPAGTPVYAIADGIVIIDDDDAAYDQGDARTWSGIAVSYRLADDGAAVTLAHLASNSVRHGDPVREGQLLGYCGSTGASTGPHLHLEIRDVLGELVEPIAYMEEGMFTNEDRAKLDAVLAAVRSDKGTSWGQEIFQKLEAGFSTTLATWLRRVVLGRDPVLRSAPVVDPDA